MKTIFLAAFILINSLAFSQNKKQCTATTKAGTQCTRKTENTYCKQHDPNAIRCSGLTKSGKQCSRPVKKEGDKCFQHSGKVGYLYNAYDKDADENFVIKAFTSLPADTIVHYDSNAVVTCKKTPFMAKIISLYTK